MSYKEGLMQVDEYIKALLERDRKALGEPSGVTDIIRGVATMDPFTASGLPNHDKDVFSVYDFTDVTSWCRCHKKAFKLIIMSDGSSGCEVAGEHFESDAQGNCLTKARDWTRRQWVADI